MPSSELDELIETLARAGVEFILVGGAAAVLHGAAITTQDIDIVHRRTPENAARLAAALGSIDAVVLDLGGRRIEPTASHFLAPGQLLMMTRLGRLDALGALHDGRGFEELIGHTDSAAIGQHELRLLDLPTLIEVKSGTGRAKDRIAVSALIELLRARQR